MGNAPNPSLSLIFMALRVKNWLDILLKIDCIGLRFFFKKKKKNVGQRQFVGWLEFILTNFNLHLRSVFLGALF